MASGMEAAEASTCPFGTEETTTASVKKVPKSGFHCGNTGHHPNHCCFRSVTCHACKQRGHPAVMCSPKQQSSQGKAFSKVQRSSAGNTKVVKMEDPVSEDDEELSMHSVEGPSPHPITVDIFINGKSVRVEVPPSQLFLNE